MPGSFMSPDDATASLLRAFADRCARADLVGLWLASGANINAQTDNGKTPLMLAAESGQAEMTAFLLQRGASLNQQNPFNGQTALMLAAWAGHAETAVLLYRAGALANVCDTKGQSAHSGATGAARAALLLADRERLQNAAHQKTSEKLGRLAARRKPPRL